MVADGAYAKKDFLKPAAALGMTVISRLRKDAALRTLPGPRPAGKRGRPRTYIDFLVASPQASCCTEAAAVQPESPVEQAQVRAARAQRNHIGLTIRAFLRLEHHFYTTGVSW